jgi:hypothetical protein
LISCDLALTILTLKRKACALLEATNAPTKCNDADAMQDNNALQSQNDHPPSLAGFPSPIASPPVEAPPCAALLDDFPKPRKFLDPLSHAGPVDPYDSTLWRPESSISVLVRPRDGEFEHFLLDENGCLGHRDLTPCQALMVRLKYDCNRAKSCCTAWERARTISIRARYSTRPLCDLIDLRNNIAILRSNTNYSRLDVVSVLSSITYLDTRPLKADAEIIRQSNTIVMSLGEHVLAMEDTITHFDAIIAHSRDEYLRSGKEISLVSEDDWVPVVIPDNNDKGENVVEGGSGETGVNSNAFPAAEAPPDDNVIDISDEE